MIRRCTALVREVEDSMRQFNKLFGVGISRTGTTSLAAALNQLGIPTIHWPTSMHAICKYRGAVDTTVACRYVELDQIFPGSLFIYTERDASTWLESVRGHFRAFGDDLMLPEGHKQFAEEANIRLYGAIRPIDRTLLESYTRHHESLLSYFKRDPDRLLRMNLAKGDGWGSLCSFLGLPIVDAPFPHINSTEARNRRRRMRSGDGGAAGKGDGPRGLRRTQFFG
jgi:Sulfotransferase domain